MAACRQSVNILTQVRLTPAIQKINVKCCILTNVNKCCRLTEMVDIFMVFGVPTINKEGIFLLRFTSKLSKYLLRQRQINRFS